MAGNTIDRAAREMVLDVIDKFLNDQIDALEFEERLEEAETHDRTVGYAVQMLSYHYDDCINHQATLQKDEWDFIQRLKLLLTSDEELAERLERRWSWDNGLALVCFTIFLAVSLSIEWGWHLYLIAIPFGLISIGISKYRESHPVEWHFGSPAHYPFSSYSQLRAFKRQLPQFSKQRYRREIGERRIRSRFSEDFLNIQGLILQVVFGPVALAFQGLPTTSPGSVSLTWPQQVEGAKPVRK